MPKESGKILIVEDDIALREVTAIILRDKGYEVIEAVDASEVISLIKIHNDIDLLLTDLIMPGKFGHDVALEVTKALPNAKVILMSGFGPEAFSQHLKDLGYTFLSKPVSVNELLNAIRAAIGGMYDDRVAS